MRQILKLTTLAAALAATTLGANAQTITLKVHHFLGPQTIQHTTMLGDWCRNIARDSKDRLKCDIFPAMQLGGTPVQLYEQTRDGVVDVAWTLQIHTPRLAKLEVFELPFMMTNAEATSRAAWDYAQKFAQDDFKDVKMLAIHVHGPGNIYTKAKPVTQMADLKGMKVRAPTRQSSRMLALMGATPVSMPVPQVPEALSKGVIDGAVIPYEVAPSLKVNELTNFTAETDRSYNALYTTVFVMPMNKAKYDSLPADLKAVIDKNSGRELSAFMGKTQSGHDAVGKKVFEASANQKISIIPKAELEKWKKATDSLDDAWVADMTSKGMDGKGMLQSATDLIKQYTK
ncbi:TRAP transporter substrate-binding protein [Limnohabitans sp.]|jgi:TRAP-type C4-dicarboxylate transport system substrate-binding protein|uniref:TRAP transporter substrate-binding protein n=1 Tax=Limnohabitans sp. TaxID=1907725 RepID=UPI0039BC2AB3|nr:TRAP transporter substrate-binding protein [Comamonadaceae bacterium]